MPIITVRTSKEMISQIDSIVHKEESRSDVLRRILSDYFNNQTKPVVKKKTGDFSMGHFDKFWDKYPLKVNKKGCIKSFLRIKGVQFIKIMSSLSNQIESESWLKNKGEFIPHPLTWINQERWDYHVKTQKKWYEN